MSFSRRHMPSLQELVAFEAVARQGNFTRAAEELALTQSAVSKQLQQLERALGAVLLKRNRGRVTLTPAGSTYLNATQEILARFPHGRPLGRGGGWRRARSQRRCPPDIRLAMADAAPGHAFCRPGRT